MSSAPVTLDMSQAQPIQAQPVTLDLSKATPISQSTAPQQRTWLDSATDFAKGVWQQVNPVSGVKGAAQLAAHPVQSYMADAGNRQEILDQAESDFKKGNYGAGVAHALYGIIPFLGPQMNQAGTNIGTGNVATGLGQSTGMGLNLSTPALVRGAGAAANALLPSDALESASQRLYQSALKPPPSWRTAKVNSAVQGGLENAVPVAPESVQKISDLMEDTNQKIADAVASQPNRTINKFSVASRLQGPAQNFGTQVNPEADMAAVANSGNEFLRNQPNEIPAVQAQAIKQGTYGVNAKKYGELGSAAVESQKALARGLKEELANAFPELSDLNAADSRLINLDDAMQRAVKRISNHQLMGIGTPLAAAGAKSITGSTGMAAVTGMLKAVLDDPFVKSKVAIALNRASNGQLPIEAAQAKLAAYTTALGNVANPQSPDNANTQ